MRTFRCASLPPFHEEVLPKDLQRVYNHLVTGHGEDYALTVIFTMRTAVELHRAWHMTLLTSKVRLRFRFQIV